jgi:cation diffusion facilitator family transporter
MPPENHPKSFLSYIPKVEARAAIGSLVVSVILVAVKFTAYWMTGSAAIFSDALENVVNIFAAAFAVYALGIAHRPADEDHPYGHGKIEFLSAGFEGGMILLAAMVIAYKTIASLIAGHVEVERLGWGLLLTAAATLVNGGFGLYLIRLGKSRNSVTLEADGHHLMSDAVTSIAALAALFIVVLFRFPYADPIAALLISIYIAVLGVSLMRRSFAGLMDRQDAADEKLLTALLDAHIGPDGEFPRICGYHKLRHRHSGRYHWVDFHISLPVHFNLEQGHNVASAIEHEVEQTLGEGNATAHVEPCLGSDCEHCRLGKADVPPPPPNFARGADAAPPARAS